MSTLQTDWLTNIVIFTSKIAHPGLYQRLVDI